MVHYLPAHFPYLITLTQQKHNNISLKQPPKQALQYRTDPRRQTPAQAHLVPIPRRVILRADDKTTTLLCSAVNRLDNVDEFLLIFKDPIEFVVVSGPEIAHHVLVSEKEHDCAGIVEFVHSFKVRDFVQVAYVEDLKMVSTLSHRCYETKL